MAEDVVTDAENVTGLNPLNNLENFLNLSAGVFIMKFLCSPCICHPFELDTAEPPSMFPETI
jgi:hypothetical protein